MDITPDGRITREQYEESEITLASGMGIVRGEIAGAGAQGVSFRVDKYVRLELFRPGFGLVLGHYLKKVAGEGRFASLSSLFAPDPDEIWIALISDHPEMLRQTTTRQADCAEPEVLVNFWVIWWQGCSATFPPIVYSPDGQQSIVKWEDGVFSIKSGDDWIFAGALSHDGRKFTISDVRRNHIVQDAQGGTVSFDGDWMLLRPDGRGTCSEQSGIALGLVEPCEFRLGQRVDDLHVARVYAAEQERAAEGAPRTIYFSCDIAIDDDFERSEQSWIIRINESSVDLWNARDYRPVLVGLTRLTRSGGDYNFRNQYGDFFTVRSDGTVDGVIDFRGRPFLQGSFFDGSGDAPRYTGHCQPTVSSRGTGTRSGSTGAG